MKWFLEVDTCCYDKLNYVKPLHISYYGSNDSHFVTKVSKVKHFYFISYAVESQML